MTFTDSDLGEVGCALSDSIVHEVVRDGEDPGKVQVGWHQATGAGRGVGGGRGVGVCEEVGEERFDVVADEEAGVPGQTLAPELPMSKAQKSYMAARTAMEWNEVRREGGMRRRKFDDEFLVVLSQKD